MAESENLRKAREAVERARALEPLTQQLRAKSKRLAEEEAVLRRAAAILQARAEEQARG